MQINPISYSTSKLANYNFSQNKIQKQDNNTNSVNFGLHNPQATYNRALQLKSDYAKMGVNYILPSKTWSDTKIARMVCRVDYAIKNLMSRGDLSAKTINEEIDRTLPEENKDAIKVFDKKDLLKYLMRNGLSKKEALEEIAITGGMQLMVEGNKCGIFLPIEEYLEDSDDKFNQLNLRVTLAHELTHAYGTKFKNIEASDDFHFNRLDDEHFYEKDFFNNFEQIFYDKFDTDSIYDKVKVPSESNFYKFLNVRNEGELFDEFDMAFNRTLYDNYAELNPKIHNSKQFYNYCSHRAKDEKLAYMTNSIMDEYEKPYGMPIKNDYQSELYAKMEKYFKQRAEDAENFVEEQ